VALETQMRKMASHLQKTACVHESKWVVTDQVRYLYGAW